MELREIAQDTIHILRAGSYRAPSGHTVELAVDLHHCVTGTRCYEPDELSAIREQVLVEPARFPTTSFEVSNETTLQAAARLAANGQWGRTGALNFASPKNPGGGFLSGARAQEESLARSSGLYRSLLRCPAYYDDHRSQRNTLYSDRMIYSPRCPVFRSDDGTPLERPYLVDFLTSPAPNAGAIQLNEPHNIPLIEGVLRERSARLPSLAIHHSCEVLILGAWGCGVFRNDPVLVANIFWEHLSPGRPFWGRFRQVLFAVWDASPRRVNFKAFAERFH
jgi:uncharacterized protein (TIGR02452 family)